MKFLNLFVFGLCCLVIQAQTGINKDPFRQLDQQLPTPNDYRNASGSPGHRYWHKIDPRMTKAQIENLDHTFDCAFKLEYVKDHQTGANLKKTINYLETADVNSEDNFYPRQQQEPSRFELFKQQQRPAGENEMQRAKRAAKT